MSTKNLTTAAEYGTKNLVIFRGGADKTGEVRREQILQMLKNQGVPLSGATLARQFHVSRQVIVQDIALMRAENHRILSTNKGYLYRTEEWENTQPKRVFYVKHTPTRCLRSFSR